MKEIILVTGNKHKLEIAKSVLGLYDIDVKNIDLDVDEIQETNIEKIATKSALLADKELDKPVIKTDVGFEIDALNGFPGAFGKYVFNQLGTDGILRLLNGKEKYWHMQSQMECIKHLEWIHHYYLEKVQKVQVV